MKFHLDYFDKWGTEAADWVVSRARDASSVAGGGSSGETSGASDILKKGISHPVSNVFVLLIVLFGL
jgi:acetylxylan esterase